MAYIVNPNPHILDILFAEYKSSASQSSTTYSSTAPSLFGRKTENRLLNTQARIEYDLLKAGILAGVLQINKFLDLDDQIITQEYKLCTSLSYRGQIFVMEFRQLPTDSRLYNHALDLVFQGSNLKANTSGRTTLVLAKESNKFIWRQLNPIVGGPSGNSKDLASMVLHWLQDENTLFMRFLPLQTHTML